jgi:hypothetical protein
MMTNEEAEALGRRALAAGFDAAHGGVFLLHPDYPRGVRPMLDHESDVSDYIDRGGWPDFRDWATLGVLVGQTRRRLGMGWLVEIGARRADGRIRWAIADALDRSVRFSQGWHDTKQAAWVSTLEASS